MLMKVDLLSMLQEIMVYSLKVQRCYTSKDWHARSRVNAIGVITDFKLFNVCLFDCYMAQ